MVAERGVSVRDARSDERDLVRELTLAAYAQYATIMTPSAWSALQTTVVAAMTTDAGAQQIVCERDGQLIGSVLLFPPWSDAYPGLGHRASRAEIRMLAVAPHARGFGVGRVLVTECIRRARASGADAIGLHTSSSMREAIRLYETLGFVRDAANDIRIEGAEPIDAYRLSLRAN